MSYREEIGPKETVIPEQKFYSCFRCKFYEHRMIRSGQHPVYESVCKKLTVMGEEVKEEDFVFNHYHLNDGKTPDCCPYLKSVMRNDKIDKIL